MIEPINVIVVSLFDGPSGGRLALESTNLKVLRYYSSEIDKHAIQVADHNWPQDTSYRLGDVTNIDFTTLAQSIATEFPNIPILLIGGSPCQGFSMSGKLKGSSTIDGVDVTTLEQYLKLKEEGFEFDGQSYLFWEYVNAKNILNPTWYMLENVKVTKKWLPMFNDTLETEPLFINSECISAQNRPRYYWTNIKVPPINICNATIADIIDTSYVPTERYSVADHIIDKTIKPGIAKNIIRQHQLVLSSTKPFQQLKCTSGFQDNKIGLTKLPCLRAGNNATYLLHNKVYRRMTVLEAERAQTWPDNYSLVLDSNGKQLVSDSQRYRMIGNSWTIKVPNHILSSIKDK